jgi:hypothetical protein
MCFGSSHYRLSGASHGGVPRRLFEVVEFELELVSSAGVSISSRGPKEQHRFTAWPVGFVFPQAGCRHGDSLAALKMTIKLQNDRSESAELRHRTPIALATAKPDAVRNVLKR